MKSISIAELEKAADTGACLVLDVRTPSEFGEAHITGSINIPLPDLERFRAEIEAKSGERPLVLICRSGRRAEMGLEKLGACGIDRGLVLEGGLDRWIGSGRPIARGRKSMSIERQVRVCAGALVVIGSLLGALVNPWFMALSGFVGAGLVFAGLTDTCGMAMLLARLPMNRAKSCPLGEA